MSGLPTYKQLTTVNRGAPCQEYPGTWYVYLNGNQIADFSGVAAEMCARETAATTYIPYENCVEVGWQASDNDPRIGEVWFTGYYNAYTLGNRLHKFA